MRDTDTTELHEITSAGNGALAHETRVNGVRRATSPLTFPGVATIVPVDEDLWRDLMTPVRDRWKGRAQGRSWPGPLPSPPLTPRQAAYADRRARRLEKAYATRPESCGTVAVPVACACRRSWRHYTCRQHLTCETCRRKRATKTGARIRSALERQADQLGGRMHAVLVTLTVRHTGDIGQDRRDLVAGWRRFYKRMRRRIGPFPFIGVHEITPGTDALGHPHAHVVVFWPYIDWSKVAAMWRASCPQSMRINMVKAHSVRGSAKYISKYVSKGVQTDDFSPELRARALAGTYGARWLFASHGIWTKFDPVCPCCKQSVVREIVAFRADAIDRWTVAGTLRAWRPGHGFLDDEHCSGYQPTIPVITEAD